MSSGNLLWKFKGSTGPFSSLTSVTLPCEVSVVREKLKMNFGLSESTTIDFVIYLESDPDVVVSDYYVLPPNSKIYTRRCASEEASALISAANSMYKSENMLKEHDQDESNDLNKLNDDYNETNFQFSGQSLDNLYEASNQEDGLMYSKSQEVDDEDTKIAELIKGQSFYDSRQTDSLSRRYYRNRMLLPNQKEQPTSVPEVGAMKITPMMPTELEDPTLEIIPVDADYICHMCGEKGHHIRNCTNTEGKRLSKKIRPSTGIPTDFLTPIPFQDIGKYEEVYILKDNTFAVMREIESVSGGAFFTKTVDQRIQTQLGISEKDSQALSRGFKCTICYCYFNNPVTTLCCGETFCLDCIIGKKNTSYSNKIVCPTCRKNIKMTDLQSNTSLKKAVQSLILGNVDVLKKVNKEPEKNETEQENVVSKVEKKCGFSVENLKRQRLMVDKYLSKYRTYKNII